MFHCRLCLLSGTLPVFLQAVTAKVIKQLLVFLVALGFDRKIAVRIDPQIAGADFPQLLHFCVLLFLGFFLISQVFPTQKIIADGRTALLLLLQQLLKFCVKLWRSLMVSFLV